MEISVEYHTRIARMTAAERMRRAEALFRWSRDYLVRSILASQGSISDDELKLQVAEREYGQQTANRAVIDELRRRVRR